MFRTHEGLWNCQLLENHLLHQDSDCGRSWWMVELTSEMIHCQINWELFVFVDLLHKKIWYSLISSRGGAVIGSGSDSFFPSAGLDPNKNLARNHSLLNSIQSHHYHHAGNVVKEERPWLSHRFQNLVTNHCPIFMADSLLRANDPIA